MHSNVSYSQKKPSTHAFSLKLHRPKLQLRMPPALGGSLPTGICFPGQAQPLCIMLRRGKARLWCGGSGRPGISGPLTYSPLYLGPLMSERAQGMRKNLKLFERKLPPFQGRQPWVLTGCWSFQRIGNKYPSIFQVRISKLNCLRNNI